MKLYKTGEVKCCESYPYGRLRTKAFFSVEFVKGKGFRSVFQTINPKTGILNKPKKNTYTPILLLSENDENGHFKTVGCSFYSEDKVDSVCKFMSENFDLFNDEQNEFIGLYFIAFLWNTAKGKVIYCGADFEKVKTIIQPTVDIAVSGIKNKTNFWGDIKYPLNEMISTKVPNSKPFTVTTKIYRVNERN